MKTILFVCSGNIFRSMCAELLLKSHLSKNNIRIKVWSAGTTARKQEIHKEVKKELDKLKIDYTKHTQKKLTKRILDSSDIVISMTRSHQKFIQEYFSRSSFLFNEICYGKKTDFLDYPDILKKTKSKIKVNKYLRDAVKEINKATFLLLSSKHIQSLYIHEKKIKFI